MPLNNCYFLKCILCTDTLYYNNWNHIEYSFKCLRANKFNDNTSFKNNKRDKIRKHIIVNPPPTIQPHHTQPSLEFWYNSKAFVQHHFNYSLFNILLSIFFLLFWKFNYCMNFDFWTLWVSSHSSNEKHHPHGKTITQNSIKLKCSIYWIVIECWIHFIFIAFMIDSYKSKSSLRIFGFNSKNASRISVEIPLFCFKRQITIMLQIKTNWKFMFSDVNFSKIYFAVDKWL